MKFKNSQKFDHSDIYDDSDLFVISRHIIFVDDPEAMNYEESQCTAEPEVDCEWQEWSECSKSCGIGTRIRYKNWMCQGDLDEEDLCNMDPCPDQ